MENDNSKLDNFTDALMLLTASHPRSESVWRAAINDKRYSEAEENPNDALIKIYHQREAAVKEISYARYWHGYLIALKPLLLFMNYGQIRSVIMCDQLLTFICSLFELMKRKKELVIPFIMTWIFLNPVSTMLSL